MPAGLFSFLSFCLYILTNINKNWQTKIARLATIVMVLAFISLTLAIVMRGIEANRFPLANLYESTLWFNWAIIGGYLVLLKKYPIPQLGWLG